jgi:hypothetical protein
MTWLNGRRFFSAIPFLNITEKVVSVFLGMAASPWYIYAPSGYTCTGPFLGNAEIAADKFRFTVRVSLPADLLQFWKT